jgi:phosphatidylcholine synthase
MTIRKILAWGVHLYTALGLVAAAGIAVLIVRGGAESFRQAFVLMFAATAIDTTDGWLARKANVKKFTPGFDGRRLDDLIDFHTYTTLPLLLIWRAEILPAGWGWWLLVPLVASAYGFSQVAAKTADHFFIGFPSYWNIVAFYLYLLRPPAWLALGVVVFLALLTFVPSRYLYTTHGGRFSTTTNVFGTAWAVVLVVILARMPDAPRWLTLASLSFPAYYLALSWLISFGHWRGRRGSARQGEAFVPR